MFNLPRALCTVAALLFLSLPAVAALPDIPVPTGEFKFFADGRVFQRDDFNKTSCARMFGLGTASNTEESLALDIPAMAGGGGSLYITIAPLQYYKNSRVYFGSGIASTEIDGQTMQCRVYAFVRVKASRNGVILFGAVRGTDFFNRYSVSLNVRGMRVDDPATDPVVDEPVVDEPGVDEPVVDEPVIDEPVVDEPVVDEPVVDEPVIDDPVVDQPTPGGTSPRDRFVASLNLPVGRMTFNDVPERFRPPSPNDVAEYISADDPNLVEKLKDTSREGWLVVRSDKPFPLGAFEFAGWVKLDCPELNPAWDYNSFRGIGSDDRIWLECMKVTGIGGNNMIFQGVEYVYTDRVLFQNLGHVICDTTNWGSLSGCVLNTEFRKNYHDPFSYYNGAAVNVAITSVEFTPSAHLDVMQENYANGVYWKHVWAGSAENPVLIMGIRGLAIQNSYFEDVRHYQYPGTGHTSLNIVDASGTVFKNCIFTGELRVNGATFIND